MDAENASLMETLKAHKGLGLMEMAGIDLNSIDLTPIVREYFPLTVLKRHITVVWEFVDVYGHVAIITKRGKPDCVLCSLETYLLTTQFATDEKTLQNRKDVQKLIRQRDARTPRRRRSHKALPAVPAPSPTSDLEPTE